MSERKAEREEPATARFDADNWFGVAKLGVRVAILQPPLRPLDAEEAVNLAANLFAACALLAPYEILKHVATAQRRARENIE